MRLIHIVIVFLLLANTGCSSVEKCIYLRPLKKNNNWIVERNKQYRGYYDYETHYYFSRDSLSTIRVSFTNRVRPILIGPPVIPIFPMFSHKTETFEISIYIRTFNDTDLVSLSKYIQIEINDELSFLPCDTILTTSPNKHNEESGNSISDKQLKTNKSVRIRFRYKIKPNEINNLTVSFDQGFNKKLKSNFKDLNLQRKNRLHYNALFFPNSYEVH